MLKTCHGTCESGSAAMTFSLNRNVSHSATPEAETHKGGVALKAGLRNNSAGSRFNNVLGSN